VQEALKQVFRISCSDPFNLSTVVPDEGTQFSWLRHPAKNWSSITAATLAVRSQTGGSSLTVEWALGKSAYINAESS